jgi:serine/threonine protein kinase
MCEIKVLDKLDKNINLVNMIGACTAQQSSGKIWLILEYCPCGDMKNFLNKNSDVFIQDLNNQVPQKILNARLFIKWAYDIVKGMEYLSLKNIMHGDLAARNILIHNLDNENYVAKVTDFGLSKAFYDKTSYKKQDRKNVPWKWMDIAYLKTGVFQKSSDVWSFGVVFWEMLSIGQVPYLGGNAKILSKKSKLDIDFPHLMKSPKSNG